jgi:hypothetical protein
MYFSAVQPVVVSLLCFLCFVITERSHQSPVRILVAFKTSGFSASWDVRNLFFFVRFNAALEALLDEFEFEEVEGLEESGATSGDTSSPTPPVCWCCGTARLWCLFASSTLATEALHSCPCYRSARRVFFFPCLVFFFASRTSVTSAVHSCSCYRSAPGSYIFFLLSLFSFLVFLLRARPSRQLFIAVRATGLLGFLVGGAMRGRPQEDWGLRTATHACVRRLSQAVVDLQHQPAYFFISYISLVYPLRYTTSCFLASLLSIQVCLPLFFCSCSSFPFHFLPFSTGGAPASTVAKTH